MLLVRRVADSRVTLSGGDLGEIPLVRGEDQRNFSVGQELEVFLYRDHNDSPRASTIMPRAQVGQFAYLRVAAVTKVGAFLDWGLPKDLLVPFREQQTPMEFGRSYIVYIYIEDRGGRLVASSRLERHVSEAPPPYKAGQAVELLIHGPTDLGYKAIVEHCHWGLLFKNEVSGRLRRGERTRGYIRRIRPDGKIDLSLHRPGDLASSGVAGEILAALEQAGGAMPLNDKSSPERIREAFGVSKKVFKKALGNLYRKRLITMDKEGVRLVGGEAKPEPRQD